MHLLQGQDCGWDVESVENLIRRHEETEREAGVIQERGKVRRSHNMARYTVIRFTVKQKNIVELNGIFERPTNCILVLC
jgi:hypothetical protein